MPTLSANIDLDAMLVFNLTRTQKYLGPLLDAGLRDQRVTSAQFNTLLVLQTAGDEGLRMGEIGERLVVTKANVTGLVDRLESHGFVMREDQEDRRATAIRLTDEGRAFLAEAVPQYLELSSQLTAGLSEREKQSFVRLLSKLRRSLRRQRDNQSNAERGDRTSP